MNDFILNTCLSRIQSLMQTNKDFPQKLKKRLVQESNKVTNPFQLIFQLFTEGVLSDTSSDPEQIVGLTEMMVHIAIMIVCSKGTGAIGSLMKALEGSGNLEFISELWTWIKEDFIIEIDNELNEPKEYSSGVQTPTTKLPISVTKSESTSTGIHLETYEWLETSPARKKNYPVAVKNFARQPTQEQKVVRSTFFEQATLSDGLSKVGTFNCQQTSDTKGISAVQFDKERMISCSADGTLNLWNWGGGEEDSTKIAVNVKNVTCFEYDEEIIVMGTADGTVHLFDARTMEENWTLRLGEPVNSLKFVESTLVVITRTEDDEEVWWIDISRPDMRLLNQWSWQEAHEDSTSGICMCPDVSFIYSSDFVSIHDTKSGTQIEDHNNDECFLNAPADISTLAVGDLVSTKRVVVAGCIDGRIAMWNATEFVEDQRPVKTIEGHIEKVVSLCFFNGHILSLDERGKLLMWSGYDLTNDNISKPVPRVLAANSFSDATRLVAHERWFAASSSQSGIINIWTLPDLWLRTG